MNIRNTTLDIIRGNIADFEGDAIVAPANTTLVMEGGVGLVLKERGGQVIEDAALRKSPQKLGEAIATGAGDLAVRHIIHAITHTYGSETNEHILRNVCRNALRRAQTLRCRSIAIPALGCGMAAYPCKPAAKILAQEIYKHCRYEETTLESITLVLYDDPVFRVFEHQVMSYLKHLQEKLTQGPFITVDIIIETDDGIILIERSNPPFGWALPGGFVDYGETLEKCAVREAKEETGLDIFFLEQMHTYSDPKRDPRFHTITTVFIAKAKGKPQAGDDAQNAKVVPIDKALKLKLAFDHVQVLRDYVTFRSQKSA